MRIVGNVVKYDFRDRYGGRPADYDLDGSGGDFARTLSVTAGAGFPIWASQLAVRSITDRTGLCVYPSPRSLLLRSYLR